ncbi:MAG: thioredoxin [Clostridiales bacterium]|nr:thioredoxin [Clostridiales bacterium]
MTRKRVIRILLCAAAVIFIVVGVLNGGARDVLAKAVKICSECIGLG